MFIPLLIHIAHVKNSVITREPGLRFSERRSDYNAKQDTFLQKNEMTRRLLLWAFRYAVERCYNYHCSRERCRIAEMRKKTGNAAGGRREYGHLRRKLRRKSFGEGFFSMGSFAEAIFRGFGDTKNFEYWSKDTASKSLQFKDILRWIKAYGGLRSLQRSPTNACS